MLASLGLDIYSDWQSEQLSGDQAKMSIESIDKMLENLARQQEELRNAYGARKEIATDIYGNKVEDVTYKARRGLEGMGKQYRMGEAMTDMAFHGGFYEKAKEGEQSIKYDLTSKKRDFENQLGQTLADITIKETSDMANIENTIAQLKGQRKIQQSIKDETHSFWEKLVDPLDTGLWDEMNTGQTVVDIGLQGGVGSLINQWF